MKFTNINLIDGGEVFEYKVGYRETDLYHTTTKLRYTSQHIPETNATVIQLFSEKNTLYHHINAWYKYYPSNWQKVYLPALEGQEEYKNILISDAANGLYVGPYGDLDVSRLITKTDISQITVYFPYYSLNTKQPDIKYALTVYMWLNGFKVILGSYLVNRFNACANMNPLVDPSRYYDEYTVDIINPKTIVYSEAWKAFREVLCNEQPNSNYTGIDLVVQLDPVEFDEESECYTNILSCAGGENVIVMYDNVEDMKLSITHNLFASEGEKPLINCSLSFHSEYKQDVDGLKEYIQETYGVDKNFYDLRISYDLALRNDDDIYFYNMSKPELGECLLSYDFESIDSIGMSNFERISWEWIDAYEAENKAPLYLQCMSNIYIKNIKTGEESLLLYFKSNNIPLTHDIMSYFLYPRMSVVDELDEFWALKKVELNNVNMNLYNIDVVNKTENIIKQFDYVNNDSKSNIVQPVFYRVQPLSSITLHRGVVENIAINLDQYKSKVKRFKLKIGNTTLVESGRVKAGIIFVSNPSNMTGIPNAGVYHVLNERGNVVTSGNYTCI